MPAKAGSWAEVRAAETAGLRAASASALADWLGRDADWHLFATYTFDERKGRSPRTAEHALSQVSRFLELAESGGRPGTTAISFAEQHRSGLWHAHGVLGLPFGLARGDIKRLHALWYARHGYCRFEPPRSESAVSRYLAKYLTKELSEWSCYPSRGSALPARRWSIGRVIAATDP